MRVIIVLASLLLVAGCSSTGSVRHTDSTGRQQDIVVTAKKFYYGYRPQDPCIRCGEKWQQLPNWDNEAIVRRSRGEQW
jgi:uncharacterized protein YcfL